jgi:F-type H+-transporting ATPase subunit b
MSGLIEDPTFWVAVAFVIFVAAAFKKVRDGLNSALDGRAARIKAQLDEARQLREEAQAALAEYQRKVRDAAAEAKAIVDHARVEAERLRERARADQEHALKRREQLAIEKIAQAEAEALKQVRNLAVDLAVAATARLLAENMGKDQAGRLINEAIQELPDKLH